MSVILEGTIDRTASMHLASVPSRHHYDYPSPISHHPEFRPEITLANIPFNREVPLIQNRKIGFTFPIDADWARASFRGGRSTQQHVKSLRISATAHATIRTAAEELRRIGSR